MRSRFSIQLQQGLPVEGYDAKSFRDRWGLIPPRADAPALYDPACESVEDRHDYLMPIFTGRPRTTIEHMRQTCSTRHLRAVSFNQHRLHNRTVSEPSGTEGNRISH